MHLELHGFYICCDSQLIYIYDYDNNLLLSYNSYNDFLLKSTSFLNRNNVSLILEKYLLEQFEFNYMGEDLESLFRRLFVTVNKNVRSPTKNDLKINFFAGIRNIINIIKEIDKNVIIKKKGNNYLNIYKMSKVMFNASSLPKPDEPLDFNYLKKNSKNIDDFLKIFLGYKKETETYEYVLNHLSFWFQNIGKITPQVNYYLTGAEGTGKGMFVEKIIFPMFNEEGDVVKMSKEELKRFNDRIENKFAIFFDEIHGSTEINAMIKNIVSNEWIPVEGKNLNSKNIKNIALFFFSKNNMHKNSILDSGENRRFTILNNNTSLNNSWGQDKVYNWNTIFYKSDRYWKELTHFAYFLLNYKTDSKLASKPQQNEIRELLFDIAKDNDSVFSNLNDFILCQMYGACMANSLEPDRKTRVKIILFYDEKKKMFILNRPMLITKIRENNNKVSKSTLFSYLFEKFGFSYLYNNKNNIGTYRGVTSVFLKLEKLDNVSMYNRLKEQYYKDITRTFTEYEDENDN